MTAYTEGRAPAADKALLDGFSAERMQSSLNATRRAIASLTAAQERFRTYEPSDVVGRPFSRSKVLDAGDKFVATVATDERHAMAPDRKVFKVYDRPSTDIAEIKRPSKDLGSLRGQVDVERGADGRWEVKMVEVAPGMRGQGVATSLYAAVQKELGIEMSPSGILLSDGYAFWKKRDPEKVKYH